MVAAVHVPDHHVGKPYLRRSIQGTMAQDPQAQANRKRNATRKIARLKAAAAAKQEATKTEKAS
jgi:hypothetical protein